MTPHNYIYVYIYIYIHIYVCLGPHWRCSKPLKYPIIVFPIYTPQFWYVTLSKFRNSKSNPSQPELLNQKYRDRAKNSRLIRSPMYWNPGDEVSRWRTKHGKVTFISWLGEVTLVLGCLVGEAWHVRQRPGESVSSSALEVWRRIHQGR